MTVPLQLIGGQEVVTLTTSTLAAGPHTVTASFVGYQALASSDSSDGGRRRIEPDAHADSDGDGPGPVRSPDRSPRRTVLW